MIRHASTNVDYRPNVYAYANNYSGSMNGMDVLYKQVYLQWEFYAKFTILPASVIPNQGLCNKFLELSRITPIFQNIPCP
jgi:hypothetical protein